MDTFSLIKMQLPQLALTDEDIAIATANDPELKKLHKNILLDSKKYSGYGVRGGCILFGTQIWIPTILQHNVLEYLHIEHVGVSKMMALALSYHVYWPSIYEDIENLAKNCPQCIEIQLAPKKALVNSWVVPKKPWEKIHIDYGGPFMGNFFFLVIDEYSLWPEVFISNSSSTSNTIEKLKLLFSIFGYPKVLVSDSRASFMEEEFQIYLKRVGIEHHTCVPRSSASYNKVVKRVSIYKRAFMELKCLVGSVQDKLHRLLFTCRRSQISSTMESPAKLFFGRELSSIQPNNWTNHSS